MINSRATKVLCFTLSILTEFFPGVNAHSADLQTVPVKKRVIEIDIKKTGLVIPGKKIRISSETAGIIEKLNINKGDIVKKGMILAEVDRKMATLQYEAAKVDYEKMIIRKKLVENPYRQDELEVFQLQVAKAEADNKNANNRYKRTLKLFEMDQTTKEQLDESESFSESARFALAIARENFKIAKDGSRVEEIGTASMEVLSAKKRVDIADQNLNKTEIASVVTGIVSDKFVEEGEFVTTGQPLLELVVPDPIKVSFALSEQELLMISSGEKIFFTIPAIKKKYTGKVTFISPVSDPGTHLFNIELSLSNKSFDISPGMTAIISLKGEKVIAFPIRADWLKFSNNELGIFFISEGNVKFLKVNQNNYLEDEILIYSGLKEGDKIVTFSSNALVPGEKM